MDRLIFRPNDVDLAQSPLRRQGQSLPETFVLGAFNPGLTRLPDGRLLLLVRVAEALRNAQWDGQVHCIRWEIDGRYTTPGYDLAGLDLSDPRAFELEHVGNFSAFGLTSLSWLLPVILDAEGERVLEVRYDLAIEPCDIDQAYGVEDPRISRVDGGYVMTVCSVSERRLGTSIYRSQDALHWNYEGLAFDHQNKDVLVFEGRHEGMFWALTRPQGDGYLLPPPASADMPGPSIHVASSPDLLHWRPRGGPLLRPQRVGAHKLGGGTPPLLTDDGWLMLYHAVDPGGEVGRYQTYWALLDANDPQQVLHRSAQPILSAAPALTEPLGNQRYLSEVVFTTGMVEAGDDFLVASGEADLACRLTRIPQHLLRMPT